MASFRETDNCNFYCQNIIRAYRIQLSPLFGAECFLHFNQPEEIELWKISADDCHHFFAHCYTDMFYNPQKYFLPIDIYPKEGIEYERKIGEYIALSKIKDPQFNYLILHSKKKKQAIKAIDQIMDFMFLSGEQGEYRGKSLQIERSLYDKCNCIPALEELGFYFEIHDDMVLLSNGLFSDMFYAYSYLAKSCKKKNQHLFFRCDFRALDPKFKCSLHDLIRNLPTDTYKKLINFDATMKLMGYKTSFENENTILYYLENKKALRINVYADSLNMQIRWLLSQPLSSLFLKRIHQESHTTSQMLFENISSCKTDCVPGYGASSPSECSARIHIQYEGQDRYICKDLGYFIYEFTENDFERVLLIEKIMKEILS